ncbi:MAG: molybdopterin-dependent oxidoreductase [Porticoccaceae bacterium]|nr:molybdopterin-dependent oxidoreductase [Porticoccaceae bacterium]
MSCQKQYRICPICEATCGLELTVEHDQVVAIRGNSDDLISLGHVCPKGVALMELRDDPDRVRTPMVRKNGVLVPASWNEAFAYIQEKLSAVIKNHGRESVALYIGNATIGSMAFMVGFPVLLKSLATPQLYTAGTLDHIPKLLTCAEMYGDVFSNPVPDIDRSQYLLILGANPMVSNGSLWLAPGFRGRVKDMKKRGGKLVVIDPRRTETARIADQHFFIRPGTDPYFLLGLLHVMFRDDLVKTEASAAMLAGLESVEAMVKDISLAAMASLCGIAAKNIEAMAYELVNTQCAGVYGRVGSTTQEQGTVTSWLIEVVNIVAGNLDIPGGMMFPKAPAFAANTKGQPGIGKKAADSGFRTRVRNRGHVCGELPSACLAEEIATPGEGQIRALISICGNPALSAPNSERLQKALPGLDFLLSFDIYINETSRHADVILPGTPTFEKSYYGAYSINYASRNVARFSPALFESPPGWVSDWDALLQVSAIAAGMGVVDEKGLRAFEDQVISALLEEAATDSHSIAYGIDIDNAMAQLSHTRGIERIMDVGFRVGPYGDGFGANPAGLTLEKIIAAPNGIDLGPLQPRLPEVLRTPSGKVEMAPPAFMAELSKLLAATDRDVNPHQLLLIGRRQSHSINSWGHNVHILAKGKNRCTLLINPLDVDRLRLEENKPVVLTTTAGQLQATLEITDEIMPGVVSLPHGWGHNKEGTRLNLAQQKPGVNINILMDDGRLDALTGNAVLNGVGVQITQE